MNNNCNAASRRLPVLSAVIVAATLTTPAGATDSRDRWAVINANGTVARHLGVVSAAKLGVGKYRITFNRNVPASTCALLVTLGNSTVVATGPAGEIGADRKRGSANIKNVYVHTRGTDGTFLDRPFHLYVACGS